MKVGGCEGLRVRKWEVERIRKLADWKIENDMKSRVAVKLW
jgi:hypothetical protein